MRSLTILILLLLSFLANAQNSQTSQRVNGVSTYTVCNPDSCGTFQLMYNDVYNVYGLYKTNRKTYYYNTNDKNSYGVYQYCTMNVNDTVWNNQWKWTIFYDSNNNLTDSVDQYWDATLQQWSDTATRSQYAYDINHNVTSIYKSTYNYNWTAKSRILHTYNSANLLITSKFQRWDTTSNKWLIYDSLQCIYDSNNRLTNKHYYSNSTDPIVWYFSAKDTIYYNPSNLPTYLLKTINLGTSGWMTGKEINWTYDGSDRILSRVCTGSSFQGNLWEPYSDDHYSYDSFGRQKLDFSNGSLYYSNCNFVGINEKNEMFEFSIFPNPTNSTVSIKSILEYNTVKITNAIGQTVLMVENRSQPISVSELANGIYFIQLFDKKGTILKTEKFIKN